MIKAAGSNSDGVPMLLLGLSAENMRRLSRGKPIRISSAETKAMGLPELTVVILGGDTESDIIDDLRAMGWVP